MGRLEGYRICRDFSILHRTTQSYIATQLRNRHLEKCHPPVLMTIWLSPGLSQNQLASILKFNKGAVAKLIKTLEAEGYVRREADTKDRRVMRLYLTEKSENLIPVLQDLEKQWANQMIAGFSEDEKAQLRDFLERIIHNMNADGSLGNFDFSFPENCHIE